MRYTISVCIPTCDRPALLEQALASCFAQDRAADEIVIGDDSGSDETQLLVEALDSPAGTAIAYQKNAPRLGQNANINSLFQRARGTHVVLLHDDDLLTSNALGDLLACWEQHADLTAAYGKQYVIDHAGHSDLAATAALNEKYRRTAREEGLQPRPIETGILQQFPNDAYMVTAEAARSILWRLPAEVGNGGDYDFGLRLASNHAKFFFRDVFTAKYRRTASGSISGSKANDSALQSYRILRAHDVPPESAGCKTEKLKDLARVAIMQAIAGGKKDEAWSIYRSADHPWSRRLSPGGIRKLVMLLSA